MNNQDYENKKRECWEEFKNEVFNGNISHSSYGALSFAFDRAYALGKQEKDAEDDKTLKVNRQLFCRLCADADDYINEHLEEEDSDYGYYQGRSDALHELYSGECKDADTVTIDKEEYDELRKYRRYAANWANGLTVCPICGEYNPSGYICANCNNDKD